VLGVLPELRRDGLGALWAASRCGDLVQLRNPWFPMFLLNDPDDVAHVLRIKADNYRKSLFTRC
jgi:hypothetical protein